jgi:hypothetical protein
LFVKLLFVQHVFNEKSSIKFNLFEAILKVQFGIRLLMGVKWGIKICDQ